MAKTVLVPKDTPDWQQILSDVEDTADLVTNVIEQRNDGSSSFWGVETPSGRTVINLLKEDRVSLYVDGNKIPSTGENYGGPAFSFRGDNGGKILDIYNNGEIEVKDKNFFSYFGRATRKAYKSQRYNGFPRAVLTQDKNMIVCFSSLSSHIGGGYTITTKVDFSGKLISNTKIEEDNTSVPAGIEVLGNGDILLVNRIVDRSVSPSQEKSSKIYKSEDGGISWQLFSTMPNDGLIPQEIFKDRVTGNIYVGKYDATDHDLFVSTDGASTWSSLTSSSVSGTTELETKILSYSSGSPEKILQLHRDNNGGIYQVWSLDGGSTWNKSRIEGEISGAATRPKIYQLGGSILSLFGDRDLETYWIMYAPITQLKDDPSDTTVWSKMKRIPVDWNDSRNDNDTGYAEIVAGPNSYQFVHYRENESLSGKPDIYIEPITLPI
jgi:hypothetical protein